jgi:hypothetical protein
MGEAPYIIFEIEQEALVLRQLQTGCLEGKSSSIRQQAHMPEI